jgi:hypothetical protein
MRMLLPLGFLLLVLALGPSCGEDVVGPLAPDSTSQDFTFEVEFFDSDGLTWLHDICYINDTCIWAVGWIVKNENGERNLYNAVRWNGKEWLLQQVYDSMPEYSRPLIHTLDAVYGSAPDNIWFACGTLFVHWDGSKFTTVNHLSVDMKGGISECWASGPDNIWMGGMNGELVHFNGRIWKRIKNDIEYEITGIWGNGDTVLIATTENPVRTRSKFYIVVDEKVQFLMEDTSVVQNDAVWFEHMKNIMAEGPRLYRFDGSSWQTIEREISGKALDMCGNNANDVMACGHVGAIRHWNGKRWKIWWKQPGLDGARFHAITMHGNKFWAVSGSSTGKTAFIVTGTRPG